MPPTIFKFTRSDGHIRRVTFQELPTWHSLASKLLVLYDIPVDKIGVSYVDSDHDEITLSTDEELQDFYDVSHQPGQTIKLTVLDLSLSRETKSLPQLPVTNPNRNTFGQDNFDFIDDWQRLPGLLAVGDLADDIYLTKNDVSEAGPHAFVEVLSSNNSALAHDNQDSDTDTEDDHSTVLPAFSGKGKARALSSLGAASTTSIIDEEVSQKHPIHVYDLNSRKDDEEISVFNNNTVIPAQSTPKVKTQDVKDPAGPQAGPQAEPEPVEAEDPPLPPLESPPVSNASGTLSNDLASLLACVNQVVSSHPELSEGIRNIIHNATNGNYWQTHRAALSQAANSLSENFTTSDEERRKFEEDAAKRVSDALGNIFRSLSQSTPSTHPEVPRDAIVEENLRSESPTVEQQYPSSWNHGSPQAARQWRRSTIAVDSHRPFGSFWHMPPWSFERTGPYQGPLPMHAPPPHGPAMHRPPMHAPPPHGPPMRPPHMHVPHMHGPFPRGQPPHGLPPHHPQHSPSPLQSSRGPPPTHGPPPPGPPPHMLPTFGPPPGPPPHMLHTFGPPPPPPPPPGPPRSHTHPQPPGPPPAATSPPPPVPPPPPPPGHHLDMHHGHEGPHSHESHPHTQFFGPTAGNNHRGSFANPFLPLSSAPPSNPTTQDARAQVEAAKRLYKAEKERYRQEREKRRQEREGRKPEAQKDAMDSGDAPPRAEDPTGPPPVTPLLVSNAWGSYPELEMISVPKRSNTHIGHGSLRRVERKPEDLTVRALSRIARKLSDMGFTEKSYPALPEKIKAQMPVTGAITKEQEDDVVTTLLEGLLAAAPRSPVASGSGLRDNEVSGTWQ
ncbi:hypothetical protein B0H34DRAFT_670012 [Crassisporium funariophilum]|nr:hypothetical protein B0H34DRAFT_670012 [Crassisporium funariophilum]